MLEEAISEIGRLAVAAEKIQELTIDGRKYTDRSLTPVPSPEPECRTVSTLTGFADLVKTRINDFAYAETFVQVVTPKMVLLGSLQCNEWGKRAYHAKAELPNYGAFPFGQYLDQEQFIIGLQSFFDQDQNTEDLAYVYKIAGRLKAEQVAESSDDGITQTAAIRSGAVLADKQEIKKHVTLTPWRTFREIQQPSGKFIFRLKNREGSTPLLSLHVADGEMWQINAMHDIKVWLTQQLTSITIVA